MADMHPLVQLMLKRMESHPEEFCDSASTSKPYPYDDKRHRWESILTQMQDWTTEEEHAALKEGQRIIVLDALYNEAMDEMLNGDQRRAEAINQLGKPKYATATQLATQYAQAQQANQYEAAQNQLLGTGYNQLYTDVAPSQGSFLDRGLMRNLLKSSSKGT